MRHLLLCLCLVACEGPAGPQGPQGANGSDGSGGPVGPIGDAGTQGEPGTSAWVVGPGLRIHVTGLSYDATGAHVSFTLTDIGGIPLDRAGHLTAGPVDVRFALAQLATLSDGSPGQYTAYTTITATSPINQNTATQAQVESSGTFTTVDVTQGTYTYTFAAPLTGMDPTQTQTVLAVATRTFNGVQAIDRDTLSMRPDNGTVAVRQEVTDQTCNACHGTLGLHGGRYNSPAQCVLCHQPQTTDPDTGNTVDFKVMIHKIHDGAGLPSVIAGTPYQIIGFNQSVHDWSTVQLPQPVNRCEACHAGAQGDRWETMPLKATCTSCHDNIVFTQAEVTAGKVLHASGQGGVEQQTEANCIICHAATSLEPIKRRHYTGTLDPALPTVALTIQSITNTGPGQLPVLTFQVMVGGAPRNILTSPMTRLRATIAGPNTDFATYWQATIQGTGAAGTLAAVDAANGIFSYTYAANGCSDLATASGRSCAIPTTATGSYSVGMEGYIQAVSTDPRNAAYNPTLAFAVTDATPQQRRVVVDVNNCNNCHNKLALHGGSRQNPQYCVFCHNTTLSNPVVARFEGGTSLQEHLSLRNLVHKIHAGENLTQPFTAGGRAPTATNPGGTLTSFNEVRYPRALNQCQACHTSKNWTLPLAATTPDTDREYTCSENPAADTNAYCDDPFWTVSAIVKIAPQTSSCTSCHDAPFTAAHAQLNTTPAGVEACATCHGPGMDWDVTKFHGTP